MGRTSRCVPGNIIIFVESNTRGKNLTIGGLAILCNFWFEKPFDYSYGLAGGSLFSSSRVQGSPLEILGSSIKFYYLGLELKYFPSDHLKGLFTRIGLYGTAIDTNRQTGTLRGWSYHSSIGWEFLIKNMIGLAPEIGIRQGYAQGLFFTSYSLGLGIHFYINQK